MNTRNFSKTSINIKDATWFVYFLMSYTLGDLVKYNHYITTIMIVVMTACAHSSKMKLKIGEKERPILYYYGLFSVWIILSWMWVKTSTNEQKTIVTSCIEITAMLICMIDYINNNKWKIQKLMHIYVQSTTVFGIVYYISSPISTWGTEKMGGFTPIWRNSAGYYFAFAAAFSFYLYMLNRNQIKHGQKKLIWIALLLCVMAVGTGSRKVFVQIALIMFWYALLQKGITKKIKMILGAVILALVAIEIGSQIPAFQSMYADRLLDAFMGMKSEDGSTIVRSYMRVFAFELFLQKPLIGNGLNAFMGWMAGNTSFLLRWNISAMYSHCNQVELLCNAGIIGFLLYYCYPVVEAWKSKKCYYKLYNRMGISIIASYIILDYGTISYYMRIYLFILFIGMMCLKVEDNVEKE